MNLNTKQQAALWIVGLLAFALLIGNFGTSGSVAALVVAIILLVSLRTRRQSESARQNPRFTWLAIRWRHPADNCGCDLFPF